VSERNVPVVAALIVSRHYTRVSLVVLPGLVKATSDALLYSSSVDGRVAAFSLDNFKLVSRMSIHSLDVVHTRQHLAYRLDMQPLRLYLPVG